MEKLSFVTVTFSIEKLSVVRATFIYRKVVCCHTNFCIEKLSAVTTTFSMEKLPVVAPTFCIEKLSAFTATCSVEKLSVVTATFSMEKLFCCYGNFFSSQVFCYLRYFFRYYLISRTEYNHMGAVTEFKFSNEIGRLFRNKNSLKYLRNWGPEWSMLPSEDAIVFVDNHDNQRGHGAGGADILTYKEPELYKLAVTFMLAHPYGKVTRIMSSYDFTDTDQGPPITEDGEIRAPEYLENQLCDTGKVGWVCEHRWPEIHQMVKFRNVVGKEPLENWWENGENQIAFSRGNLGFVAFNLEADMELKALIQTGLPRGSYCDILSGAKQNNRCTGLMVDVNEQGLAVIDLPQGHQALAIYIDSKLDWEASYF